MDYYNEFDAYPAAWMRNLQAAGHIPQGRVDERSITDVKGEDLEGVKNAHFFAGIGGWSRALRLAGWPDDEPVWTGSCPCQPFSVAGARKGTKDKRHLWPDLFRLIGECRPPVVFGEQVASKDGRDWLVGVRADLEGLGYAVGAADLCAAGAGEEGEGWFLRRSSVSLERTLIGAPHIRQRLYWVAYAKDAYGRSGVGRTEERVGAEELRRWRSSGGGSDGGLANPTSRDAFAEWLQRGREYGLVSKDGGAGKRARRAVGGGENGALRLGDPNGSECPPRNILSVRDEAGSEQSSQPSSYSGMVDGVQSGLEGHGRNGHQRDEPRRERAVPVGSASAAGCTGASFWRGFDVLPCADGKARRVESGTFPLAHGIPARVGKLRAYGNAIVPEVAAIFIRAFREAVGLSL